jgi:hypothetical protein
MTQSEPAKRFSAWDLLQLWERNDKAAVGDELGVFQIYEMPPWDQICRVMSWEHFLVEGGFFAKKGIWFHWSLQTFRS